MKNNRCKESGFTLIELLIVMIIMGMLASLVGPKMFGKLGMAKSKTALSQIDMLSAALDSYRLDINSYPTNEQGLQVLRKDPGNVKNWIGPYVEKDIPLDPWGNAYIYKIPGDHGEYDLYSHGADNKSGGDGEDADVGNWQ